MPERTEGSQPLGKGSVAQGAIRPRPEGELPSMQVLPQLAMREDLVGFRTWQPEERFPSCVP